MSTDRDTTRIVRSWLRTDEHESADRVLDAVLDRLDTTPQRRVTWWPARRLPDMNTMMKLSLAAAAVVIAALLGYNYLVAPNVGGPGLDDPSPTPTPTPAALGPTPAVDGQLPAGGPITEGSYIVGDPFAVPFRFEIGSGWGMWGGAFGADVGAIYEDSPDPPAGHGIIFVTVANTYADPCNPSAGGMSPEVGPTVEDLATAIAAQPGTESTDPVPVSIDGHDGLYLAYSNNGEACSTLSRWPSGGGDRLALTDERDQVWILDVDGERLVIDAFSFNGTSQADLEEMRELIEGIDFSPATGP